MIECYPWQQEIWHKIMQSQKYWKHALILKGKRGIGKYAFARCLVQSLLCHLPKADRMACGHCISCGWFEQNGHPNFYSVMPDALSATSDDDKTNTASKESSTAKTQKTLSQQITVDQIRRLNDFIYHTGHQDGYKVILVYPAETMTLAAANALLKKLEEPPADVLFILVTHLVQHLLPTIRSRCQQIAMPIPSIETSMIWLKQQGINNPEVILPLNDFSPLSAWSFVQDQLTLPHQHFIEQITSEQKFDPLTLSQLLQSVSLSTVTSWLQKWCYDLVSYRTTGKIRYYLQFQSIIQALSQRINLIACITFARELNNHQKLSTHPLNARLFLEEMFIRYRHVVREK
ncbi:MAG: DNA polymerase III subunit delta' [Nitrosomonas sp.]